MRFMIIIKATPESEKGAPPDEKLLTEMGKFNEELVAAGIMIAGEGLQASQKVPAFISVATSALLPMGPSPKPKS